MDLLDCTEFLPNAAKAFGSVQDGNSISNLDFLGNPTIGMSCDNFDTLEALDILGGGTNKPETSQDFCDITEIVEQLLDTMEANSKSPGATPILPDTERISQIKKNRHPARPKQQTDDVATAKNNLANEYMIEKCKNVGIVEPRVAERNAAGHFAIKAKPEPSNSGSQRKRKASDAILLGDSRPSVSRVKWGNTNSNNNSRSNSNSNTNTNTNNYYYSNNSSNSSKDLKGSSSKKSTKVKFLFEECEASDRGGGGGGGGGSFQRCLICEKFGISFWTRKPERLDRHLTSHVSSTEKGFKCPSCGLKFNALARMLRHDRTCHTGVKDYECRICGAEVTDIGIHLRTHREVRNFECPECHAQFGYKSSLVRHMLLHVYVGCSGRSRLKIDSNLETEHSRMTCTGPTSSNTISLAPLQALVLPLDTLLPAQVTAAPFMPTLTWSQPATVLQVNNLISIDSWTPSQHVVQVSPNFA